MSASQRNFPLGGTKLSDTRATATCYCGSVSVEFPTTKAGGLVDTFVCNCSDCRKITASMFATNFIVANSAVKHLRGQQKLTRFEQNKTIANGNTMSNYFCSVCGSLMYRVSSGSPGYSIMRTGTVDDFSLHHTTLKPRFEVYVKDRVDWWHGVEGAEQHQEQPQGISS